MKTVLLGLVLNELRHFGGGTDKWQLDDRIRALTAKFVSLEHQPGKAVPPDVLRRAKGIVLLDRNKAGFLFAYPGWQWRGDGKGPADG